MQQKLLVKKVSAKSFIICQGAHTVPPKYMFQHLNAEVHSFKDLAQYYTSNSNCPSGISQVFQRIGNYKYENWNNLLKHVYDN